MDRSLDDVISDQQVCASQTLLMFISELSIADAFFLFMNRDEVTAEAEIDVRTTGRMTTLERYALSSLTVSFFTLYQPDTMFFFL